jgi:hypothetical protein
VAAAVVVAAVRMAVLAVEAVAVLEQMAALVALAALVFSQEIQALPAPLRLADQGALEVRPAEGLERQAALVAVLLLLVLRADRGFSAAALAVDRATPSTACRSRPSTRRTCSIFGEVRSTRTK